MRNGDVLIPLDRGGNRPSWGRDGENFYVVCRCGAKLNLGKSDVVEQKGYGVVQSALHHDCGWAVSATLEGLDDALWRRS